MYRLFLCTIWLSYVVSGQYGEPLRITDACLDCIAQSRDLYNGSCVVLDNNQTYCGRYQISEAYFHDCQLYQGVSDNIDFKSCALDDECATNCTRTNLNQYAALCQKVKRFPNFDCADFAALHYEGYSGPESCGHNQYGPSSDRIEKYWNNLTTVCECSEVFEIVSRLKSCWVKLNTSKKNYHYGSSVPTIHSGNCTCMLWVVTSILLLIN